MLNVVSWMLFAGASQPSGFMVVDRSRFYQAWNEVVTFKRPVAQARRGCMVVEKKELDKFPLNVRSGSACDLSRQILPRQLARRSMRFEMMEGAG